MGAVAQEKEPGYCRDDVGQAAGDGNVSVTKFAASTVTFSLSLAGAALAAWYHATQPFHVPSPPRWLALNALAFVYIMPACRDHALLQRPREVAGGRRGIALAVIAALGLIGAFSAFGQYLPGQLLGWAGGMVSDVPASHCRRSS
ncbi:MAG: hypothetical protein NVS4B3_20110 [Gemmatimonadaceae bacterium]